MESPILETHYPVRRPSGIPQFRFRGSEHFKLTTGMRGTNGKGHTPDQARASGIMEMVERYSCFKYLDNGQVQRLASFREMSRRRNPFGLSSLLSGFIGDTREAAFGDGDLQDVPIRWYPAHTLGGESLYLPASLSKYLLHGSNGMAAGNSLEEAVLQAVCEILERHCTTLIFTGKAVAPLVDISTVGDPVCGRLLRKFLKLGHPVWIKDFSLGLGIPVIGVVRAVNSTNCHVTAGVASSRQEALLRALTENSQVETQSHPHHHPERGHLFDHPRTISFQDIPGFENRNIRVELHRIERILNAQGMRPFYLDTTDGELGLPSVIAFVSGAKHFHENMAYRNLRFGVIEDLLETRRFTGVLPLIDRFKKADKCNTAAYEYYRGLVFLYLDDIDSALAALDRAAAGLSGHELAEPAVFLLGLCRQAQGRPGKAAAEYLRAMKRNSDYHVETSLHYRAAMKWGNDRLRTRLRQARLLYEEVSRTSAGGPTYMFASPRSSPVFVKEDEALALIKLSGRYPSVVTELETRTACLAAARKAGLKVSAQDLREADEVSRRRNGPRESEDHWRRLGRLGISEETWEDHLRTNILIDKFLANAATSADPEAPGRHE
jgi:tetratricopeptide (TPR) repeat protein